MATRSASWSDNEVRALIAEWLEEKIKDELEGSTRNKDIFEDCSWLEEARI